MLTSVRSLMAATVLASSALLATPAMAQDDDLGISFSANVALVSQYRFRGVDLSGGDIAVQGGIDLGLPAGFYIGTWASTLDEDTVGYGHTEVDFYAGWSGGLTGNLSADVGVLYYAYPNAGPGPFDVIELYGSLTLDFDPAEVTFGVAWAPSQDSLDFGAGDDNFYAYLDLGVGIPGTPITVSGHLGYTDGSLAFTNDGSAWDWSIGADVAITDNVSIGAAYIGAEGDYLPGDYRFTRDAFVVTLGASF